MGRSNRDDSDIKEQLSFQGLKNSPNVSVNTLILTFPPFFFVFVPSVYPLFVNRDYFMRKSILSRRLTFTLQKDECSNDDNIQSLYKLLHPNKTKINKQFIKLSLENRVNPSK